MGKGLVVIGRYVKIFSEVVSFYYVSCNRRGPEWLPPANANWYMGRAGFADSRVTVERDRQVCKLCAC